jgi:6,7-dimethyl-8-ribityllumazine synthase
VGLVVPCALILVLARKTMNQMLQDPQAQEFERQDSPIRESDAGIPADPAAPPPPRPDHPRFARPQRIAFVQACWHREVVEEAKHAFLTEIEARHISRAQVDIFEVPGSFEIPLHAQVLAKTRRYSAIVAAGLVASIATNSSPTP